MMEKAIISPMRDSFYIDFDDRFIEVYSYEIEIHNSHFGGLGEGSIKFRITDIKPNSDDGQPETKRISGELKKFLEVKNEKRMVK